MTTFPLLWMILLKGLTPIVPDAQESWPEVVRDMAESREIHAFYTAFAAHNAEAMLAAYAPDIEFNDPVFGTLKGAEARSMWRMLLETSKGQLIIQHQGVLVKSDRGQADWEAWYPFSATGNYVHNVIHAEFEFKNGKISRHHDNFDLSRWACQALAPAGCIFGGQSQIQDKIRASARQALDQWMKAHPESKQVGSAQNNPVD